MLNSIMEDGSRYFANFPETVSFERLREIVNQLENAREISFITDQVTEAWLDFTYQGHSFSINNQNGEFWFFVEDPACPNEILFAVAKYFGESFKSR